MEHSEFKQLCKVSKPISVICHYCEIEITFDNGVIVTIGCETEYGDPILTFETNIEKEAEQAKRDKEAAEKAEALRIFNEKRDAIRAKYTAEQWEELEQAFLFNNGMTAQQNKEAFERHKEFIISMHEKYGGDSYRLAMDVLGK